MKTTKTPTSAKPMRESYRQSISNHADKLSLKTKLLEEKDIKPASDKEEVPKVSTKKRRSLLKPYSIALTVIALVAIVFAAMFFTAYENDQNQLSQGVVVRQVSTNFLTALTNFNPKTVDSDLATLGTYATGNFKKQASQFFGSNIRQALEVTSAASRGQVRNLYLQSLSGNSANVYAVVDQTYVNNKMSTPSADVLRLSIDLTQQTGGKWLISDVTVLGNSSNG